MSQRFRIRNKTRDCDLATAAWRAGFLMRGIGLMGRRTLPQGEALILPNCRSITMFFMRFPLDVVFLDSSGKICGELRGIRPWRVSGLVSKSRMAIELPAGTLEATGTELGDQIEVQSAG